MIPNIVIVATIVFMYDFIITILVLILSTPACNGGDNMSMWRWEDRSKVISDDVQMESWKGQYVGKRN